MTDDATRPFPKNPNYRLDRDGRIETFYKSPRLGHHDGWKPIGGAMHGQYPAFYPLLRGKRRPYFIHVAMLEAWVGPRPAPGMVARHKNDDKLDFRLENMIWGTRKENNDDAKRNGKCRTGINHPQSAFDAEDIEALRFYKSIGWGHSMVALMLEMNVDTVRRYMNALVVEPHWAARCREARS